MYTHFLSDYWINMFALFFMSHFTVTETAEKHEFQNWRLKQWNSCQFAILVEQQSGGSDLWDPSCLLPPGSITLDAHFQGHLTNSAVKFDNGGNIPKEPHTAAAWAFV